MTNPLKVLFLEDRLEDVELMLHELRNAGFDPVWRCVETEQDFLTGISPQLDLILADYSLPQFDGLRALDLLIAQEMDVPFILVSGVIEEELAVLALKRGAADYLMKDRLARLGQATRSALEGRRVRELQRKATDELRRSEVYYRSLIENSTEIIVVLNGNGTILYDSPSLTRTLGYCPEDRIGQSIFESVHPEDLAYGKEVFYQLIEQRGIRGNPHEIRLRHADGSWRTMEIRSNNLLDDPAINGFVMNVRDITARVEAEKSLKQSEERFRKSVENMLDSFGIYTAIRDGAGDIIDFRVDYVNSAACLNSLMPSKDHIGHKLLEIQPEHRSSGLFVEYCKVVETGEPLIKESLTYNESSGSNYLERAVDIHVTKLEDGFAATWRDVTERKRAEEELRHISTHDVLTGLYNRTYFETEVDRLKQGRQYPVSVIIVDVDRMKQMNDNQGHSAGDDLLRRTSAILKLSFRAEDVVARIGGDEFAVLLPQTDNEAVQTILNRIRVNLFTNQILQDSPILSFSIGAATAENGERLEEVIHRADKSMYRDKLERTRPANTRIHRRKES